MAVRVPLLSLGLVLFAASAAAQDPFHCWSNARFDDLNDISYMIHQAAQIEYPNEKKKDRRQDFEYALDHKENTQTIRARYAATGDFQCGNMKGQAQLTVRNNVITTSAHLLYKTKTCEPLTNDFSTCKFTLVAKGKVQTASVKQIVKTGYKCPGGNNTPDLDWAVIELDQPIPSVKPYRIDRSHKLSNDKPVVAVGKSADFLVKGKMVKHYADCHVGNVLYSPRSIPYYLATSCDGSHGGSGGSLLSGNTDDPALIGILQAGPENGQQAVEAGKSGKPLRGDYDKDTWGTGYVPIAGDFLDTLLSLSPSSTEPPPKSTETIDL